MRESQEENQNEIPAPAFFENGDAFVDVNSDGTYCMIQGKQTNTKKLDITISSLDPETQRISHVKSLRFRNNIFGTAYLGEKYNYLLLGNEMPDIVNTETLVQDRPAMQLYQFSKTWDYIGDIEFDATYDLDQNPYTIQKVFTSGYFSIYEEDGELNLGMQHDMCRFVSNVYYGYDEPIGILISVNEETLAYSVSPDTFNLSGKRTYIADDSTLLTAFTKQVGDEETYDPYAPRELFVEDHNMIGHRNTTNKQITEYAADAHNSILALRYYLHLDGKNYLFWGQGDNPCLPDGTDDPNALKSNERFMMAVTDDEGNPVGEYEEIRDISYACAFSIGADGLVRIADVEADEYGCGDVRLCTLHSEQDGELVYEYFYSAQYALGDLDGSGVVNSSDAALILIAAANVGAGYDAGLTQVQKDAADVNHDGASNALDASIVLQYAAMVGAGASDVKLEDLC